MTWTRVDTAQYMIERYGKDAEIHCSHSIINNEGKNETAFRYWSDVYQEIIRLRKEKRNDRSD